MSCICAFTESQNEGMNTTVRVVLKQTQKQPSVTASRPFQILYTIFFMSHH